MRGDVDSPVTSSSSKKTLSLNTPKREIIRAESDMSSSALSQATSDGSKSQASIDKFTSSKSVYDRLLGKTVAEANAANKPSGNISQSLTSWFSREPVEV
jgi:hypothetical protein